ncbi:reverse transcriptase N-terminal domain-containing protein, partial [Streptomyces mirabilis]
MPEAPAPRDKLDAVAQAAVNGPEDEITGWLAVDWQQVEDDVRRLRQRIFTASQAGDQKRVRNLQKLMLRHGSCSSSVRAGQRVAGAGAGMSTATVIMNVCDDVSRRGGRGSNDSRAGVGRGVREGDAGGRGLL